MYDQGIVYLTRDGTDLEIVAPLMSAGRHEPQLVANILPR
jgi:hypothetical protein